MKSALIIVASFGVALSATVATRGALSTGSAPENSAQAAQPQRLSLGMPQDHPAARVAIDLAEPGPQDAPIEGWDSLPQSVIETFHEEVREWALSQTQRFWTHSLQAPNGDEFFDSPGVLSTQPFLPALDERLADHEESLRLEPEALAVDQSYQELLEAYVQDSTQAFLNLASDKLNRFDLAITEGEWPDSKLWKKKSEDLYYSQFGYVVAGYHLQITCGSSEWPVLQEVLTQVESIKRERYEFLLSQMELILLD